MRIRGENGNRRKNQFSLVRAARVLGATLAMSGILDTPARANSRPNASGTAQEQIVQELSQTYGVSPSTITGKGLRKVKYVEGRPAQSLKKTLAAATVGVVTRPKGSDGPWQADGSGTVVNVNGQQDVLTASHLFNFSFTNRLGVTAVDLLSVDKNQYAVTNPSNGTVEGTVTNAGYIQGKDGSGPDISLLKINPTANSNFTSQAAIPMNSHTYRPPRVGQTVDLYSLPSSVSSEPVSAEGTYLGRVVLPLVTQRPDDQYDAVGLKVRHIDRDACEHGASGSSFVAPDGYFSGPDSIRSEFYQEDSAGVSPANVDVPQTSEFIRLQIENATRLNLSRFNVLCIYAAVTPIDSSELPTGFGVQA